MILGEKEPEEATNSEKKYVLNFKERDVYITYYNCLQCNLTMIKSILIIHVHTFFSVKQD